MLGDGLVTVASALGQRAGLRFTNTRVIDGLGHIALMHDPAVRAQFEAVAQLQRQQLDAAASLQQASAE